MIHINTRRQLIEWLEDNAPTASTQRAVRDGMVELLGLFNPIPSSPNPGWIIAVTSLITGTTWNIVVAMQMKRPFYYTWIIKEVPWENWVGEHMSWQLHRGDNHDKCRLNYEMATTRRGSKTH